MGAVQDALFRPLRHCRESVSVILLGFRQRPGDVYKRQDQEDPGGREEMKKFDLKNVVEKVKTTDYKKLAKDFWYGKHGHYLCQPSVSRSSGRQCLKPPD